LSWSPYRSSEDQKKELFTGGTASQEVLVENLMISSDDEIKEKENYLLTSCPPVNALDGGRRSKRSDRGSHPDGRLQLLRH
jgi:hypothetical protein